MCPTPMNCVAHIYPMNFQKTQPIWPTSKYNFQIKPPNVPNRTYYANPLTPQKTAPIRRWGIYSRMLDTKVNYNFGARHP